MNNLKNKIVLVTGASNGIGKSTAIEYAKMGSNLILLSRNLENLNKLKSELEKNFSVKVHVISADVRNFKELEKNIKNLPENFKKVDILINNAGLALGLEKIHMNEVEDYDTLVDTNIKGVLYMTKLIVPIMLENNIAGHIVNMGSIAGNFAYPNGAVYCGVKAAVKTISDGLRIDLVDTKIRVTNIKPGMVQTDFSLVRFKGDSERAANIYKGIEPLTPEDIAGTIIYVTNLPNNIQITELEINPVNQADARTIFKTGI
ncbi:MAG: SDR family NAD(P)-dependent oxidoreductase [Fusobacteriaceae bacterium]